jgi:DNA-binding NarL/FixJ family response regulator
VRQARDRFPGLAIVAFSSQLNSQLSRDPLYPLADSCVPKPFHLETLFDALDAALAAPHRMAQ